MGWLRQLGALFWKNYILRKRHPVLLILEVIWPLAIFAIAVIVRLGIPAGERPSCSYPERALPSAGLVPFLQSAACTLDNQCSPPATHAARAAAQQRLRALLYDLEPLLSRNTTLAALEALPTVTVVIDAIKNATKSVDIKALDEKLRLRNMFTAPDEVVDMLVNTYGVLTPEAADALMESTLNAVTLLQNIGYVDLEEIVCTPSLLTDYMLFAGHVDVEAVSTELCDIDRDVIANVTDTLLRHVDVTNLIRIAAEFSRYTGEFELALLLSDVAGLVDTYQDSSQLRALFTAMPGLRDSLPDILAHVATLLTSIEKLMDVDFERCLTD